LKFSFLERRRERTIVEEARIIIINQIAIGEGA
jgi:hypothetical protein